MLNFAFMLLEADFLGPDSFGLPSVPEVDTLLAVELRSGFKSLLMGVSSDPEADCFAAFDLLPIGERVWALSTLLFILPFRF